MSKLGKIFLELLLLLDSVFDSKLQFNSKFIQFKFLIGYKYSTPVQKFTEAFFLHEIVQPNFKNKLLDLY